MKTQKFINLHSHTEASLSDGLFSPKKWVEALKDKGFRAHTVTDHGSMASLLAFYKLMKAENMIPLLGCEFYYVDEPTIKTSENRKASHLILIAKNYAGFQNMLKMSKLSYTDGYYYKPRIGKEWLEEFGKDVVCLSACQGGVLSNEVWRESKGEESLGLEKRFDQFSNLFGKDFYVEFQGHNTINEDPSTGEEFNSQEMINRALYDRLKDRKGFQAIVTNDCHYIIKEHSEIQKVIKDVSWGKAGVGESSTVTKDHSCDSLWLKSGRQVYDTFKEHHEYLPDSFVKEGILRTEEVLEKCKDLELPKDKRYLPKFRPTKDSKQLFKALTIREFKKFLANKALHRATEAEYVARFKKEFKVIAKYNLEDYFLIVWDLIRFANTKNIYSGLGRGSAAGCLISYILDIVKVDPLEHKLLFERFLNENRCETGELPDIDLDFESERRGEIKEYIYKTYGHDNVCEIGTYGRMKLKTSLIDFAKALGAASHKEIHEITTKLDLDKEDVDDLDAAIEFDPRLGVLMKKSPKLKFMVEEIVGQIKSQGVHPAGVVICSESVSNITPVKTQKNNKEGSERILATQSEDKYVIAQGLMKVDVLGLKEYDVIHYVLENAPTMLTRENYVEKIMTAERNKPDERVWKMFQEGKTEAVFQFASDGMKGLLILMNPTEVKDLIAANALYRPGCLANGWHLDYCRRKAGEEDVEYVHKDVEAALGDTYGVIVFQEQFMEVIHRLGDIPLVDADIIRSALGKKDKEKLGKFRDRFVAGASKLIGKAESESLWSKIEEASGYSFNKSHSAAYSVLAYISQYLKVYHPSYFWAAQLHWDINKNKAEDLLVDRRAAQDMGVKYILPDINQSQEKFFVTGKEEIVWSIRSIGSVGPKAATEIIKNQPYASFEDFYKRVNKSVVKFNIIEKLIYGGAFDSIEDRRACIKSLYTMANAKKSAKKRPIPSPSEEQIMMRFRDSIGFFERQLKELKGNFSPSVKTEEELRDASDGESISVGGVITDIRVIQTKKKEPMAFVTVMDLDEIIEITVFPTQFVRYRDLLKKNTIVEVFGTKNTYNDKQNVVVANIFEEK
jgi:DNA polymerase-3 subunit alpha